MRDNTDIAIVGMSCVFPGAPDLDTYWNNIINKVNAIKVAPESRISSSFFDPTSKEIDRLYCNQGGFIDEYVDFNPVQFGIVPNAVKGTEPEQLLCLKMAHLALEDADVFSKRIPLHNAGVIIGKGGYGGIEGAKLTECVIGGDLLVENLSYLYPELNAEQLLKAKKAYQSQRGSFGSQNVMGTVPNISASIIANRFDFAGPSYTIDAACASSLISIDHAVKELKVGSCDIMLAGAVHLSQNPVLWSVFSMMGALSKSQMVRPFDKRADGVLTGEGCGFVVLRRLEDAIRDDQRIYAVLKGVGVSSDGANASLMSPSTKGQLRAIKNAWSGSHLNVEDIGYLEAHGTGTVLGDSVELETLRQFFGHNDKLPKAGLGAVKSMIGHAMPASGMAGFIKTVLALFHDTIPPTINCEDPLDGMKQTRFAPIAEAVDWGQTDLPRIAGVNAFGFGGSNAHTVLEGFNVNKKSPSNSVNPKVRSEEEVILMARERADQLIRDLEKGDFTLGKGSHRIAIFNPTADRIQKAINIIRKGLPWRNKLDISYTPSPLLVDPKNKMAYIFPGFDGLSLTSLQTGDFDEFAKRFNLPKPIYNQFKEGIEVNLGIDESCRLISDALQKLNIIPDVIAGHSMGEWTGGYAAGLVSIDVIHTLEEQAQRKYETIEQKLLMVGASREYIEPLLKHKKNIYLALDNCPQQVVVCGGAQEVTDFQKILNKENITSYILPFTALYHTPFAEIYLKQVKYNLDNIVKFSPGKIPLWSGITTEPYPENPEEIKQLHIDFMTKPVRFKELIQKLYQSGVRYFLQIGAGSTLGFIDNTLKNLDYSAIASGSNKRTTLSQLMRVVASLYVEGREVGLSLLSLKQSRPSTTKGFNIKLDLSYNPISLESIVTESGISLPQKTTSISVGANDISYSIIQSFNENLDKINKTQNQLLQYLSVNQAHPLSKIEQVRTNSSSEKKTTVRTDFRKEFKASLQQYPELKDHCPFRKSSITDDFSRENEPAIPLTMFIELIIETVLEKHPWARVSSISNMKVYQFLWILKTNTFTVIGKWINDHMIQVEIEGYLKLMCDVSDTNKKKQIPGLSVTPTMAPPIQVSDIYKDRYMFHGPCYQGIRKILAFSENGMEVEISGVSGKGAMLDNIGQTIALYYHLSRRSILPFPVGLQEIIFYADPLDTTGVFTCTCLPQRQDDDFLYGDVELRRDGKRWAYIRGWQNRKTEVDDNLFRVIGKTESNFLSTKWESGISIMPRCYKRMNTWFMALNAYCNATEIKVYDSLSAAKQKTWLLGRLAIKDAIRNEIQQKTGKALHPASFTISNDESGKPVVENKFHNPLFISIAHKEQYAVGYASLEKPVGIDIEKIIKNTDDLYNAVLNDTERKMLETKADKKEWLTRFWVAKEAYGKMTGQGLLGNPKRLLVTEIKDEVFKIENTLIKTVLFEDHIIGYTL